MELTTKQSQLLISGIKKGKNQAEIARDLGVTPGQLSMAQFCKAQVEAGVVSTAPATEASVKKLRTGGARFELIAAQTGLSVAKIKEMLGKNDPGVSRGRKPGEGKAAAAPAKGRGRTGVQPVARGKAGKATPAAARPARARTRAERAARSGNPS
jgi:hypothetical protein